MTWDEISTMAANPLVTIGVHTKDHYANRQTART